MGGLLVAVGGLTAAALSTVGCAAQAPSSDREPLPAAGATELVPLSAGNYYANVMPDHVAAVRLRAVVASAPDVSTSKSYE